MSIYTACNNGQGCTLSCNLATTYSAFGPMCNGTANNGNCFSSASAGHQNMSTVFTLPAGCTASITTEFEKRAGACTNSGMDGSDKLGINSSTTFGTNVGNCGGGTSTPGVTGTGCLGSANADVSCTLSQTGGTFMIWAQANRSDEIVTYTITLTGTCGTNCDGVLPIKLIGFVAEVYEDNILLKWNVEKETGVSYYQIEKSADGINFVPFHIVPSIAGTSGNENLSYFSKDFSPAEGLNYYRLVDVGTDGTHNTSRTISVLFKYHSNDVLSVNVTESFVTIILKDKAPDSDIVIRDLSGRIIKRIVKSKETPIQSFPKSELPGGLYLIGFDNGDALFIKKLLIN
ncbi:MAG: hypothetical protein K0S32_1724 [Bacteroidetes bacterium]|nr:hypothetical protein [Bacteroidota bacterium]